MGGIARRPRGVPGDRELVELAPAAHKFGTGEMDLVHITSVGWGRRIVAGAQLEARSCKVFGADLVYLFLARPAFRFRDGDQKFSQMGRFPFVFVVSPDKLPPPHHVYPFDTGAAVAGVYGNVPEPTLYLEDYELTPSMQAALSHVDWAFGTKAAYYEGTLRPGLAGDLPEWRAVARGWIDIADLASTGRDRPDARASAIEVAYSKSISLAQGHARLVVMPLQLLEDKRGDNAAFIQQIEKLKIERKTYDWRASETPDSFMDEITSIVRRHFDEKGQL